MNMQYCYKRGDTYIVFNSGIGIHHAPGTAEYNKIETYLASLSSEERTKILVPEPKPPELTVEQKAARKAIEDEAKEKELDLKYIRELRKKDTTFQG
jgi:hypothetical protein